MYHSGIKFIGADEQATKFVTQIIKVCNHRKNNPFIDQSQCSAFKNRMRESPDFKNYEDASCVE